MLWHIVSIYRNIEAWKFRYVNKLRSPLSLALCLGLPKRLFPESLSVKILKPLLHYNIMATWPAHLSLLDLIILTILRERYKLWSSSLWSLLESPFSSLLGSKYSACTVQCNLDWYLRDNVFQFYQSFWGPPRLSNGQHVWLLIMRSRVRSPALPQILNVD